MNNIYLSILLLISNTGCGTKKDAPMPEKTTPKSSVTEKYAEVAARLPKFYDQGFVVSRDGDKAINQGDSLLFSGLALYSLSCSDGAPIAHALEDMLTSLDGGVYRHPSIPDKEPSLDGLLGLYRGIAHRINACGETALWANAMKNHKARMAYALPAEFNLVCDALLYRLGLGGQPDSDRVPRLAAEVILWADGVKAFRGACYRVHLGLIALQTLEELGFAISPTDRGRFAEVTTGLNMPTVDHFSSRPGLDAWLSSYQYNVWSYRHQRCLTWEAPDGEGFNHPAVDYLVGFADLYGAPK